MSDTPAPQPTNPPLPPPPIPTTPVPPVPPIPPPATSGEPIWAKPSISVFALGIFLVAFVVAYWSKDNTSLSMMMGAAIAMAQQVVNYWMGSSSGSTKKTDIINKGPKP